MFNNMYGPFVYMTETSENNESLSVKNGYMRHLKNEMSTLVSPEEALARGNAFKDLYVPYKDYKPRLNQAENEKEAMLIEIAKFANIAHDLNLHLDVFPQNRELMDEYVEYTKKANELKNEFEKKYGPLSAVTTKAGSEKFTYALMPSPWIV